MIATGAFFFLKVVAWIVGGLLGLIALVAIVFCVWLMIKSQDGTPL